MERIKRVKQILIYGEKLDTIVGIWMTYTGLICGFGATFALICLGSEISQEATSLAYRFIGLFTEFAGVVIGLAGGWVIIQLCRRHQVENSRCSMSYGRFKES